MPFLPPDALSTPDDADALAFLATYYGTPPFGHGSYGGAQFDQWDSQGTRSDDANRFTADDLVAVTFLSVNVPAVAARAVLRDDAETYAALLSEIGDDRDLADEPVALDRDSAAWRLDTALRALHDVGPTISSKLIARKRPRLVPIWDSVVTQLTGTHDSQWEPLRATLRASDQALHHRLLRLRATAGLPDTVSALRVLDVVCWMEGKAKSLGGRRY